MKEFKENDSFSLNGQKYWIIKVLKIEDNEFYYTIKIGSPAEIVVFETENFNIITDEAILEYISSVLLDEISK